MGRPMAEGWWSPHTAMGRQIRPKDLIQEGQHVGKTRVLCVRAGEERRGAVPGLDQDISTT